MVLAPKQAGQLRDSGGQSAIAEGQRGSLTDREICILQAVPQRAVGLFMMKISKAADRPPAMVRRGRSRELQERREGRQTMRGQGGTRALRAQVIPGGEVGNQA